MVRALINPAVQGGICPPTLYLFAWDGRLGPAIKRPASYPPRAATIRAGKKGMANRARAVVPAFSHTRFMKFR